jgi:hypothetical protein
MRIQKTLAILFIFFWGTSAAFAQAGLKRAIKALPTAGTGPQVERVCLSCIESAPGPLQALTAGFSAHGADCSKFIDSSGEYGEWGQVVKQYLDAKGEDSHLFRNGLTGMGAPQNICPKWDRLSLAEKKHFWVWTIASLAWDEATCKANARNPRATNGVGVGLLQLDENRSDRYWRGANCKTASVASASQNLKCGLDILSELMKGPNGMYKNNGQLFPTRSYWANFRGKTGGDAGRLISQFSACH